MPWYKVCQRRSLNPLPALHTHTILTTLRRVLKCALRQRIDLSTRRSSSSTRIEVRHAIIMAAADPVRSCLRAHPEAERALLLCAARVVLQSVPSCSEPCR